MILEVENVTLYVSRKEFLYIYIYILHSNNNKSLTYNFGMS